MKKIYCIGSINQDNYQIDSENHVFLGGSACNTAFFLDTLMEKDKFFVFLVGIVGTDSEGDFINSQLEKKGFNLKYIEKIVGKSGSNQIFVDINGERRITRLKSNSAALKKYLQSLDFQEMGENPLVHYKGDLQNLSIILKKLNEILSCDISGLIHNFDETSSHDIAEFKKIMINVLQRKKIHILFGNHEEFNKLSTLLGENPISFEKWQKNITLLQNNMCILRSYFNADVIALKQGRIGAKVFDSNIAYVSAALSVDVKDSTGAGDAFNAGFLFGYLSDFSLKKCLEYATVLGSLNCTHFGGQSLKISVKELNNFVKNL
ncbi:carbohydrate kinase family protein [Candidatus Lokiarchaeum ossiferum]|uniref:carbohydrate kinase family protein n=1 Tax=Candidatus Lokiarchaeum ossiferum TaxID=2951803 RepID=UPI00352D873D